MLDGDCYKTCMSTAALGCCKHYGRAVADDGILHVQGSVIGRSGNLYNSPIICRPSYYPTAALVHLYLSLLYRSSGCHVFPFTVPFVTASVYQVQIKSAAPDPHVLGWISWENLPCWSKSIFSRKNVGIGFYGRQFLHHKPKAAPVIRKPNWGKNKQVFKFNNRINYGQKHSEI